MAQVFLASVGVANAFRRIGGKPVHFFTAKTLTDSSINLSVSAEEVRGGEGGKLLGQFFHTSTFGLSMTDAMFKLEYIAAQVGSEIINGGYGMVDDNDRVATVTGDQPSSGVAYAPGDKIKLTEKPIALLAGTDPIVWYNVAGSTDYATVEPDADGIVTIPGATVIQGANTEPVKYCLHYFADKAAARKVIVNSNFVPEELTIFLTTRLYAGDASAPETGKPVGTVTIKIPRFQLNGTADIALAMASAATVQLQGNALSYDDGCEGGKYAEIVEVLQISEFDGYTQVVVAADSTDVGEVPQVYLVGERKTPKLLNNAELKFTVPGEDDALVDALGEDGKISAAAAGKEVTVTYDPKANGLSIFDPALTVTFTPTTGA